MKVSDAVEAGLRCPSCNSEKLRAGYHEWQLLNSWICDNCGFRWMEDIGKWRYEETLMDKLKNDTPQERKNRLIWVLHIAREPNKPLKSTLTSDDSYSYEIFIRDGLR